ncbi:hypothetical protein QZM92_23025, partial [Burkholderia multivorans]|nr:hypothetical protein [Burkholderia multivorans]
EVRPEYERNSPRMSSNSYVNLKIATCLVRYADDRLIDQRFLSGEKIQTYRYEKMRGIRIGASVAPAGLHRSAALES